MDLKFFFILFCFSFPVFGKEINSLKFKSNSAFKNVLQSTKNIQTENPKLLKKLNLWFQSRSVSEREIQKFLIKNNFYESEVFFEKDSYVIKNPVELIFIIRGNIFFSDKDIKKFIIPNEMDVGDRFYDFMQLQIRNQYQNQGFLNIKMNLKLVQKNWKKWIYLNISEGNQIQIARLSVSGVFSKSRLKYEKFILDHSTNLIKKGFYSKKGLEVGYKNLVNYLKSEGYLQSKIYLGQTSFKKNKAFINVNLVEGPLTFIRDIKIQNSQDIPIWEILSQLKSKVQSPLKIQFIEEDVNRIEQFYKSRGYLWMKIKNRDQVIQYQPGEKYASIVIDVDQGPKAFVSNISIKGLKKVKEYMVRTLLKFEKGDVLTPLKKEQSLKSLFETGLWSDVVLNEKNIDEKLEVEVLLKEHKTRSVSGGLGVNSQRGLTTRLYSDLTHRNLFGQGRTLIVRGSSQMNLAQRSLKSFLDTEFKKPFLEYELSAHYKEVFIPGSGYQGNVSLSHSKDLFQYSQNNINFVNKTQISFFINKKLIERLQLQLNPWSFESRREDCILQTCSKSPQKIGSMGFHLVWDERDNIFNPEKGFFSGLEFDFVSPQLGANKSISFIKLDFKNQFYGTFKGKYTVSLILNAGMINNLFDKTYLPVSRAFILGGQNSVRGYDSHIDGERIPGTNFAPIQGANEALKLKKGNFIENVLKSYYGLAKLNFRFPMFKDFKWLLFYDLGLVFLGGQKQQISSLGHSTGLGFRYQTFLIPIGLDIAYVLPPRENFVTDSQFFRVHFSIGW